MTAPVTITLRQDRYTLAENFCVISWTYSATPTSLRNAFVVEGGPSIYSENYRRIATLSDLDTYAENALTKFIDPAVSLTAAQVGDVLTIVTCPESWISPLHNAITPPYDIMTFVVNSVSAGMLVMSTSFPAAAENLAWTLKRAGVTIASGTTGQCGRLSYGTSQDSLLFLRPYYVSVLGTVSAATNREAAAETGVAALIQESKTAQGLFDGVTIEVLT